MAIKGKKKSQQRGSQGQRRPAAAPRPVYSGRKHTPWYKTSEGRLIGGMLIAVVIGVTIWLVADAQSKSRERTETREALEQYVQTVRSFTNSLGPVSEEMGGAPTADGGDVETLKKDAAKWTDDLAAAQAQIVSVPPPDEASVASKLFDQSMASFLSAARTFESAADVEGDIQTELLGQAHEEHEQARGLFELGVEALDAELLDVGGENSNLALPQSTPAAPEPGQSPGGSTQIIPVEPGDDSGGKDGGSKGGGQGGGGGGQGDGN